MRGDTHILGGITLASLVIPQMMNLSNPEELVSAGILMTGAVIGALTPDIDHIHSIAGRKFRILSVPLSSIFGHRKFCHSVFFLALLGFLFFIVDSPVILQVISSWGSAGKIISDILSTINIPTAFKQGFALGFISHIILDLLTVSGLYVFHPVSKKKFRIAKLKTGTWHEAIVAGVMILIISTNAYINISPDFFNTIAVLKNIPINF